MKRIFQKFLCLILIISSVFSIGEPIFATNSFEIISLEENKDLSISVYSEEFPEAYIITEPTNKANQILMNDQIDLVTATVFVEEIYSYQNGKPIVVNSRLLSKNEVDRIGIENFENLDTMPSPIASATNRRGKLTITFSGKSTEYTPINSVKVVLDANAKWSGFDFIYNAETHPAVGKDFMGITWSGGFRHSDHSISATANLGFGQSMNQSVYLSDAVSNAGSVWEFDEYIYAGNDSYYVNNVDLSMTLWKDEMNGNGNIAEAVLKYVHTWQQVTGSASINVTPSGFGNSFSIGSASKQWSIACIVSGIPY